MQLREVGEFGLIDRIARAYARSGESRRARRRVVLGSGDDAAVLRPPPGHDVLISTDALVEGVHFRWRTQRPRVVGQRALLVALSDLSAMGVRPLGSTVALAAPASLALARVLEMARGLGAVAARAGCPIVGGNVTRARVTSLTLTVLGSAPADRFLSRSAARPGDGIFVTGALGAAGLALARSERGGRALSHLPPLRLRAGFVLAGLASRGACIDLSDGLLADLGHLLRASGVGAELEVGRIPMPAGFSGACRRVGLDPLRTALTAGEDYELLFTLRPGGPGARALARRLGVPVTQIGRITRRPGLRLPDGPAALLARASARGFEHF
ncbi:MAG TPA: thiamine-phosphate kinase [Myxococcota bacterium]|nr:thiamine-phosphate kinase [Myxococcota bacterium]